MLLDLWSKVLIRQEGRISYVCLLSMNGLCVATELTVTSLVLPVLSETDSNSSEVEVSVKVS